jgi:hypothetical protein
LAQDLPVSHVYRSMRRISLWLAAAAVALAGAVPATAHMLDHPAPGFSDAAPPLSTQINAGGENASWELLATIPTGNPHSDLDFFTHKGNTYAAVGTLGIGPNAGGQTIVKLTEGDQVAPSYVSGHPSAACPTATTAATGLQHDVEATPKGETIPNAPNPFIDRRDAQLLVESTDGEGRCHDNGTLGLAGAPLGGLEIVDITDPAAPKELALTSHIGEAHTVNVDPKRPHIAFDVTQDGTSVGADGKRANETEGNALDGFEVVDMKSCMNFPPGTTLAQKRELCRPQVYRFRYPQAEWATSHTFPNALQSCHEVEIYPDDTLACASITSTILFDISGAFDDKGTPADYSDDTPRGTPLPCKVRPSSTAGPFGTGAQITDCVNGEVGGRAQPLIVSEWLKIGSPSLEGVKRIGTAHHMGFAETADLANVRFDATQDIVAAHEAELTGSGRFVLTTDERGGGVVPGGASCTPGADNVLGNGGIHAFPVDNFTTTAAKTPEEGQRAYGKTSTGERAIYRAPIRTGPQGAFCTAHVFQQIPGQNRIFMGWYSQGTHVVDFVEHANGTIDFKEAAYFTPENANTWTSAIFKVERNADGTFTYYGATGDGILPGAGRGAIDVYKVTLPAPPLPRDRDGRALGAPRYPAAGGVCARASALPSVRARPRGRGLSLSFTRRGAGAVTVDLLRANGRRVKRLGRSSKGFRWGGRGVRDGRYVVRFTTRVGRRSEVRRLAVRRVRGRFRSAPAIERLRPCDLLELTSLSAPEFRSRGLTVSFRLTESARIRIEARRGRRVARRVKERMYRAGVTHRVRLSGRGLRRGSYAIVVSAERPGRTSVANLGAVRR